MAGRSPVELRVRTALVDGQDHAAPASNHRIESASTEGAAERPDGVSAEQFFDY